MAPGFFIAMDGMYAGNAGAIAGDGHGSYGTHVPYGYIEWMAGMPAMQEQLPAMARNRMAPMPCGFIARMAGMPAMQEQLQTMAQAGLTTLGSLHCVPRLRDNRDSLAHLLVPRAVPTHTRSTPCRIPPPSRPPAAPPSASAMASSRFRITRSFPSSKVTALAPTSGVLRCAYSTLPWKRPMAASARSIGLKCWRVKRPSTKPATGCRMPPSRPVASTWFRSRDR